MGITDSDVTDRLDIDSLQEALKSLFIDSCGPCELRTHPPLCTENPSPHRLPFPRGRKVVSRPDSGPEPGSRHIGDSETLWNTQRNCRRSSETEVVEMESCKRKSRAKGAVKKVKFVDLVIVLNYIQEEEYDGDNEDEKIKGKEEEEEEEEGNLIDIGRSFF